MIKIWNSIPANAGVFLSFFLWYTNDSFSYPFKYSILNKECFFSTAQIGVKYGLIFRKIEL